MRSLRSGSLACAVLASLAACGSAADEQVRGCAPEMFDALGEPYPSEEHCFPGVGPDSPTGYAGSGECTGSSVPAVVFVWDRLFAACPSCGGGFSPADCRPLVCERDDDCPIFYLRSGDELVLRNFECRNSLCQDADTDRYPVDVVTQDEALMLCLANVARQGESYEGDPICPGLEPGEPCPLPLPDGCMQP